MMNEVFLVTGGEGFIGRNIISKIREMGGEAYSLDIVGKPDFKISITNRRKFNEINKKFDCVFHLAAITSPPQFETDPDKGLKINVNGTYNILDFARNHGVNKVVLASSSAIYGDSREIAVESKYPDRYQNLYPVTKIVNELFSRHFAMRNEIDSVSLRYFNTYGPGENTKGAYASPISKFISAANQSKDIEIFGDGTQSRDFIYVKDTAAASIAAYKHGKAGESYNVGTGITTTFNEIAKLVKSIGKSSSRITHVKNPFNNYQMFTQADMKKTNSELKFRPKYNLERAITEMMEITKK
ncbi:MAG: NAD-dependent epimerase/dehydratase family protein [Candidatus Thermoplasmatota archaeon]|nr:NAD-dependent epimerase/dehydratase family protein [Candidatus Thermoplasmatota archaeon]